MANIELSYLVEHCKQLPTYKDALPLVMMIQEWGTDNDAIAEMKMAIKEIRDHFRLDDPLDDDTPSQKKQNLSDIETPEIPELKFFHQVSNKKAPHFKEILRECIARINTEGKKEWFCIYAAWRYYKKEREVSGGYVDFFLDIEALFPGLLKDIKTDDKTNRRVKPYCDMLSYEYKLWAVDNGILPQMQVWTHHDWTCKYKNSEETIKRMQALIRDFYKAFAAYLG